MQEYSYPQLLHSLKAGAQTLDVGGLPVELRNTCDRTPGRLDPRTAYAMGLTRAAFETDPAAVPAALRPNADHLFGPPDPENYSFLELMRFQFGWTTQDLSEGVQATRTELDTPAGRIPLWRYEVPSETPDRPCLCFFHGGGFFAGVIPTVENQCKLVAQLSGGVVLAPDYPLAPEHPYPAGLDACYATVCYAHDNALALGISRDKIGVSGDSAGGNLALACALRDRDEGRGMIRYAGLVYPTLSRAEGPQDPYYYWMPDAYDNPENDPLITEQIFSIGKEAKAVNDWYVPEGTDRFLPTISPLAGSVEGLPPVLMMTAEYDFLRLECEEYSRRLRAAGTPCRHIRYGGIVHGTFDRLGYAPQVEDMLREIAADLRGL